MVAARRAGPLRLLAALVVGGALVGAAAATDLALGPGEAGPAAPVASTSAPDRAAYLAEAVLACPGSVEDGEEVTAGQTRLRVASAPEEVFSGSFLPEGDAGGVELALIGADGIDQLDEDAGGPLEAALEDGRWGVVQAQAQRAPGLAASQVSLIPDAGARGWAMTPCLPAEDLVHLVGGGEGAGRVELVVITNPATDPVTVDIEVFGVDGAVSTVGGSGLVIPAHGRLVQRLDALAPSVQQPVVRVVAQGGPVVAHLADRHRQGTADLGREMAAPAAVPGRELVVPALPTSTEGDQTVTLRLFAPEAEAVVELRALTDRGAHVPGTAVVRVPAGGTTEITLEGLPDASALLLRADAPVTAGALLQVGPSSDEPIVVEQGDRAADPDEAADTPGPDEARGTSSPDDAPSTAGPDEAVTTSGPDEAVTTSGPDGVASTAGPGGEEADRQAEPVLRPAGESAWVAAVPLSHIPVGMALPDLTDIPRLADRRDVPGEEASGGNGQEGAREWDTDLEPALTLAVSAVDATSASVLWLDGDGDVSSVELTLANDTTQVLQAPAGAIAFWVLPTGDAGVAAALHLQGQDVVGSYLSAASVPPVPWTRQVPALVPVLP
ncbi:DUF5719 family protein [Ornithinimicrobium pratense]|uniref:Secreted protein n=1 Tax=Ornithinimicrobium pratense TaxID=2593973 RepID=A0A5J6V2Q1_9MICO|nr:DUF5719 family protein [Ornithinimicrobium pratense]QFG68005.1 hypothetical protein FY030_04090 [Ornithinimicrobium pratense]